MRSLLIVLCFVPLIAAAQKTPKEVYGMVESKAVDYVSQTEVSVFDWLSYFSDLWFDATTTYKVPDFMSMLPDPEKAHPSYGFIFELSARSFAYKLWDDYSGDEELQQKVFEVNDFDFDPDSCQNKIVKSGFPFYLSDWEIEAYGDRISTFMQAPVTGITYGQALKYLKFAEEDINERKKVRKSDYKVELSLPSREQWLEICKYNLILTPEHRENGQTYPDSMNTEGPCPLYNYIPWKSPCYSDTAKREMYGHFQGPVGTYDYNPSSEGVYCLFGNVAEMTSEKGVAVGGSYQQYAYECYPEEIQKYGGPQPWLGFRFVGVLKEKE